MFYYFAVLLFCTYQISAEKSSENDRIASKIKVLFQWLLEIKIEGDKKMLCIAHINRTKYLILENKDKIMYAKKKSTLHNLERDMIARLTGD